MRTVIEMKIFSIIFSVICMGIVFAQFEPKEVCENNLGNIKILEAFRYESDYYFFPESMDAFKLSGVWDSAEDSMFFHRFEWLKYWQWGNTDNLRLITTVDYPGKGKSVLRMDEGKVCTLLRLNLS